MQSSPKPSRSGVCPAPSLTDDDRFALKCIRYRNMELARLGCGDPACPVETCAVAHHARLTLRALDSLSASVGASADVLT